MQEFDPHSVLNFIERILILFIDVILTFLKLSVMNAASSDSFQTFLHHVKAIFLHSFCTEDRCEQSSFILRFK